MGECEQVCMYVGRCGVWVNVSKYVCMYVGVEYG